MEQSLNNKDIVFFRDNGYLIKRKVLNTELMAQARDRLWEGAPPQLDRHNPSTWVGPFLEPSEDKTNAQKNYRWNYRQPGNEPFMVDLLPKNPSVWRMAEQLLGQGTLVEPDRVRGIYCTLPYGEVPKKPSTGCHVDAHPFHLGVVGYIDDVRPEGGSFMVWPGSHHTFYYDFHSQYKNEPTEQYEVHRQEFSQLPGADCHGHAGDIIFWHHRIGHTASHNYSSQIRQAILYDFRKTDLPQTMEEPPNEDMWRDWIGITCQ
jgi:hypothetical protein